MTFSCSVGSDVEFFCYRGGNPVASQGIIEGEKVEPHELPHGGMCHRDNVMGEIGHPPATEEDEFVNNLYTAILDVESMAAPYGINLKWNPHVEMPPQELEHWEAMILGCEPDMDCWGLDEIFSIDPLKIGNNRSAGGHVHIGFDWKNNFENQILCAKVADIFIGCGTILYDSDQHRRKLYGRAGHFRPKPYGIEYRTPSNAWVKDEQLARWIFRAAQRCGKDYELAKEFDLEFGKKVKNAINSNDVMLATQIILDFDGELPPCQTLTH